MKRYNSLFLTALVLGSNLITTSTFAQDPGFPGDPGTDPGQPVAPIDSWVFPTLLIGLVLSFLFFKKYRKVVIK